MIRVDKLTGETVRAIVSHAHPSFSGIVAGVCKGDVWVDNLEHPTLALVYSSSVGGYCILGRPEQQETYMQFRTFLEDELFAALRKQGNHYFEFSVAHPNTEKAILALFSDVLIEREYEHAYQRTTPYDEVHLDGIGDYTIRSVDEAFLKLMNAGQITNGSMISKRISGAWGSEEAFLNKGLAYAALLGDEIVAIIIGTAYYDRVLPIDIETVEEHQRQGLAYQLTVRFADACARRGFIAHWNCMESNNGSWRTASKAGFTLIHKQYVYWFPI